MSIAYDPNGNIDSMRRKGYTKTGGGGANMDDLSYTYASSPPTNRLQLVADAVGSTTLYGNDIENQTGVGGVNYVYDGSGNLIRDYQDGTQIRWNSQGKVIQVRKVSSGVNKELYYIYDAAGQRVIKKEIDYLAPLDSSWATYYVRDANEEVIAVYRQKLHYNGDTSDICTPVEPGTGTDTDNDGVDGTGAPCDNCAQWNPWQEDYDGDGLGDACDPCPLAGGECESVTPGPMVDTTSLWQAQGETVLAEWHIYGSAAQGRLGIWKPDRNRDTTATATVYFTRQVNLKEYELKDHLGNVAVVISDLKVADANVGMGAWPRPFSVEVRSYSHYYPFGMLQPGRHGNSEGYRYGYNGKEGDNSWKGVGNVYDYGFRVYDPRIGRWLSGDPLAPSSPGCSPFVGVGNSPIAFIDPDGRDVVYFNTKGEEIGRQISNTRFETWIVINPKGSTSMSMESVRWDLASGYPTFTYIQAPMPRLLVNPGTHLPYYQRFDHIIAAEVWLFNNGYITLPSLFILDKDGSVRRRYPYNPGLDATGKMKPLDPNLIKSMIYRESGMGRGLLDSKIHKDPTDIIQVHMGGIDTRDKNYVFGDDFMTHKLTYQEDIRAGIQWLTFKGMERKKNSDKVVFLDWRKALHNYGPHTDEHDNAVFGQISPDIPEYQPAPEHYRTELRKNEGSWESTPDSNGNRGMVK